MDPADLLAALREAGFSLRTVGGKLFVAPSSKLMPEQLRLIAEHRAGLIALLDYPPGDVLDALAERAWRDPPAEAVTLRESVIVRLDDFPTVAVSPEEAACLAAATAWSRWVLLRQRKAHGARQPSAQKTLEVTP